MEDKTNFSPEQYNKYLQENAKIVRDWPGWMREGARSTLQHCGSPVVPIRESDGTQRADPPAEGSLKST